MKYAYWRKVDFQLHTPRDPNWQGPRPIGLGDIHNGAAATLPDVQAERQRWAQEFIEQCDKRGLEAIAITDHHEMVMIPYLQSEILKRKEADPDFDLWLFPGMELTCHGGVQCIVIFDADLPQCWRKEAQSQLGIIVANINENAKQAPGVTQLGIQYPDISEKLDAVQELKGRYIVLPNVSQGGQHTVLKDGAHADFKRMPYVGGYLDNGQSVERISGKNNRRLSGKEDTWGSRFIYPMPTSDARSADYAKLGCNNCWIKLAAPTAEAIRQAFLGHQSRITLEPPNTTTLAIKSVRVEDSTILTNTKLDISPELNSFIGGRGSGKSTLLEYIAFGLGRSCHDIDKPEYSGSGRLKSLISDTIIARGASLSLEIIQDGAVFTISRSGGSSYTPHVTYPDGTSQELTLREVRSLFPAVVYSQGELSEIGKQAGRNAELSDLLQFVEPEFKREDDRLSRNIENTKLLVRKAVQALSSAWSQEAQLHKLRTTKVSLEQRIHALQKTLPELPEADRTSVLRYESLVELDGKRQLAEKQAKTAMDELAELWRTSRQSVDVSSPLPEGTNLYTAYLDFSKSFTDGIGQLGKSLIAQKEKIEAAGREISAVLANAKSARDTAMEKLTEHRSATAQVVKLQEELQALLTHIEDLNTSRAIPDEEFKKLSAATDALKEAVTERNNKTFAWAQKIETLSNNRIEAQLNQDHNITEILEAVDVLAAKTGSQEGTRHNAVADNIDHSDVWQFLDMLRNDSLAALRWKQVSAGGGERPKCEVLANTIGATPRILDNCVDLINLSRVEAVATAIPKPDITLFYCDNERGITFEKASEGQRAAALLFMLLEQPGGPLLVDQPEGDLDNKIVSALAEKLHTAKKHRQIIFASHNANIVVNGSSEFVVGMDVAPEAKRTIGCHGAIDLVDVCDKITETMEGGQKAFRDRKEKYGY